MKIRLKFREQSSEDERRIVLDTLAPGAERLFPEEEDPELASLYVAELADTQSLDALKRAKAVEFAEPEAERRLQLPGELFPPLPAPSGLGLRVFDGPRPSPVIKRLRVRQHGPVERGALGILVLQG